MRPSTLTLFLLTLLTATPGHATAIVTTLSQTSSGSLEDTLAGPTPSWPSQWGAQEFIPQFDATLDSVGLRLVWTPDPVSAPNYVAPQVQLWSGTSTTPTSLVGTLTTPSGTMQANTTTTLTFGGNGLNLSAGTSYWIVLESSVSDFSWRSLSPNVVCDAATCGPAFAALSMLTVDEGQDWEPNKDGTGAGITARMEVDVTEDAGSTPEPATAWLVVPLGALGLFLRHRGFART